MSSKLVQWVSVAILAAGVLIAARFVSGQSSGVSTASNTRSISAKDFGETYPFTVDGELQCEANAIVFKANGNVYPINGTAQSKYRSIVKPLEEVWKNDSQIPGAKLSVGSILSEGQKLCL